jgi:chromosome segregation ATPase
LTDADKLLRDEYKIVKSELDTKNELIKKMQTDLQLNLNSLTELKKMNAEKESALAELTRKEAHSNEQLAAANKSIDTLVKQIVDFETQIASLKKEMDVKLKTSDQLTSENERLRACNEDLNTRLQEKISELEFLNRENNALTERMSADDVKIKTLEREKMKLKFKIDDLYNDLNNKNDELDKIEQSFKNKEMDLSSEKERIMSKEVFFKSKLEDYEQSKLDLANLRVKYADLAISSDEKIRALNTDLEKIGKEKEKVAKELIDLQTKHKQCSK